MRRRNVCAATAAAQSCRAAAAWSQAQRRRGEIGIGRAEGREFRQLGRRPARPPAIRPRTTAGETLASSRQARHAARQPVARPSSSTRSRAGDMRGGVALAPHIGDARRLRLEGAARAQRHGQDRARRVQGVVRHPVDEIAQFGGQARARLPAVRRSSGGCRRPCLRPRPTPRPAFRGCPAARQPARRGRRCTPAAACSHRRRPAAKAAARRRAALAAATGRRRGL